MKCWNSTGTSVAACMDVDVVHTSTKETLRVELMGDRGHYVKARQSFSVDEIKLKSHILL